jgi:hypothetical protein
MTRRPRFKIARDMALESAGANHGTGIAAVIKKRIAEVRNLGIYNFIPINSIRASAVSHLSQKNRLKKSVCNKMGML